MHRICMFSLVTAALLVAVCMSLMLAAADPLLKLDHIKTHELLAGTHRPEILVTESGDIVVVVVQPEGRPGVGQVKHKAYQYDSNWKQIGKPFVVTRTTKEYGEPADHRAAIVHDELVVVYQTLNLKEGVRPGGGPMEQYAEDQSLMLARFSLDGKELFRKPIVAYAADKSEDNFPDHCLLWLNDRLLVSTGAHRKLKIREVDLNANILATHTFETFATTIPSSIGNSLLHDGQRLLLFSSGNPHGSAQLTITQLTDTFGVSEMKEFYEEARRQTFPTGNLFFNNFVFVGYIARDRSGSADMERNPYSPYLKVLDKNFNIVADLKIGESGFAHVHPTLARHGNRLFVGWSKRITGEKMLHPQVFIEEFDLSNIP